MRQAGIFRIAFPREWGGPEMDPLRQCELMELLGYHDASAAFMKEIGPDAVPPPARGSRADLNLETLTPEPDPPLKMIPSWVYQWSMDSIVSSTLMMKQAEHCGTGSTPTLNQTGLLNEAFWWSTRCINSSRKTFSSSSEAK